MEEEEEGLSLPHIVSYSFSWNWIVFVVAMVAVVAAVAAGVVSVVRLGMVNYCDDSWGMGTSL